MKWHEFNDINKFFVVACFIQDSDLDDLRGDLESLGKHRNVKLLVQPCPYEALEFLFRIDSDLFCHLSSMDEQIFWKALALKADTDNATKERLSTLYLDYFLAILNQDEQSVLRCSAALQAESAHFADNV